LQFFRNIFDNQWVKLTSLNAINVLLKIGSGLLTSKLMAIFIGPTGILLVGNARNFLTTIENISTVGFQKGVVKYVAENQDNNAQVNKILSTLFYTILGVTSIIGVLLFTTSNYYSELLFKTTTHHFFFQILVILMPFYIGSTLLVCVLNGWNKYKWVINLSILGSVFSLIITIIGIYFFQLKGALISLIIAPSLLSFVTWYLVFKEISFAETIKFSYFDFKIIKSLSHYSIMAMVSGIIGPLVYISMRNLIANQSLLEAGNWEALNRISNYYLLFINTILMVYYYPRLVMASDKKETRNVFFDFFKQILPMFILGMILFYFLKEWLIPLLLSEEFIKIKELVFWQAVGDTFKVASWVLGLQFFAKRLTRAFLITELVSLFILYTSSHYFITTFGVLGAVQAHALTYFLYLVVLTVYFRKILFFYTKS